MKRGDAYVFLARVVVKNAFVSLCTSHRRVRRELALFARGVRSSSVAHLLPGACATGAEYVEGAAGWPYTGCGAYWGGGAYWGCCPYCGCIAIGAGACMAYWGCAPPWMA